MVYLVNPNQVWQTGRSYCLSSNQHWWDCHQLEQSFSILPVWKKRQSFLNAIKMEALYTSSVWLIRLKHPYSIHEITIQDEKLSSVENAEKQFESKFQKCILEQNFLLDKIFSINQSELYWMYLTIKTCIC